MGPAIATVLTARITGRWIILAGFCLVLAVLPSVLLNQRRPLLGAPPPIFGYQLYLAPNIFNANIWLKMFEGDTRKYIAYPDAVARIGDRATGGVGLMLGWSWEYPSWGCRFTLNMYAYSTMPPYL